jgi:hypothetical protein
MLHVGGYHFFPKNGKHFDTHLQLGFVSPAISVDAVHFNGLPVSHYEVLAFRK